MSSLPPISASDPSNLFRLTNPMTGKVENLRAENWVVDGRARHLVLQEWC